MKLVLLVGEIMCLINAIIKWIYRIEIPNSPRVEPVVIISCKKPPEFVRYNPATGLPMVGGLDTQGNIIGTDRSSDYRYY